eukprot:6190735-Pleurochrysis_carterae.AAC.2
METFQPIRLELMQHNAAVAAVRARSTAHQDNRTIPYYRRSRSSEVRHGRQDRVFQDHARLGWRVLATLNLYGIESRVTIRAGREHLL